MNIQKAAKLFGVVFIVIGILGFVPGVTDAEGRLLGIFQIDTIHNVIHILSGIVALISAGSIAGSKSYFKIFGVVYAIVTIIGFASGTSILGIFSINGADNILHLVIAIAALYFGFRGPQPEVVHA